MTQLHEIEIVQDDPRIDRQAVVNGWNYLYYEAEHMPSRRSVNWRLVTSCNVPDPAAPHVEIDDDEKAKTASPDDDESPDKRIICGRCIGIGYYYGGFACGACLGAGYTYAPETEEAENED